MSISKFKIFLFSFIISLSACRSNSVPSPSNNPELLPEKSSLTSKAVLKITQGNVVIKFFPLEAPNTVNRVKELIKSGFYDGLSFHRVIPGFVIQTGDPTNTGTGGSGVKLKAEFSRLNHVRGTLAMARGQDADSADSQFYIALNSLPHLDSQYTIFGQVIEGEKLLDKIAVGDKIISFTLSE